MNLKIKKIKNRYLVGLIVVICIVVIVLCFTSICLFKVGDVAIVANKENEISINYEKQIQSTLTRMSLEEKVGQLFMARVPESSQFEDIEQYHLGGYLMFGKDFVDETPESITNKILQYQSFSSVPLFIAVDEEGGTVSRLNRGNGLIESDFLSPQELYNAGGWDLIQSDTIRKSLILKNYGINLNLAPVADVSMDPNSFIYERTIGGDAEQTSQYVKTVVTAMSENYMGSCLKHFPGYGDNADSHEDIVYDERSLSSFENYDFKPFKAGIDSGANSVLITHNIVECIDAAVPASLSPAIYDYLRSDLAFDGVIITDDFQMQGLADFVDQNKGAVMSIQAGGDIIISSTYQRQIPFVIDAIENGEISEERIDDSVRRILNMKYKLKILE